MLRKISGVHACIFCGKNELEVKRMVASGSAAICPDCVKECARILDEEFEPRYDKPGLLIKSAINDIDRRLHALEHKRAVNHDDLASLVVDVMLKDLRRNGPYSREANRIRS